MNFSPATVYTDDVIQATVSASDADGDALSYAFDWYVDNGSGFSNVQSTSGMASDSLDGVFYFDKGDSVYVTATVTDGSATTSDTSTTVVVQNTAPSAFNVIVTPSEPVAGADDLECIAQGNDVDGDTVNFTYAWNLNGSSTTYTAATILATDISDGDVWECTATPDDGTDVGVPNSATVTVGADVEGAVGVAWCASAGAGLDSAGNQFTTCLSETGVVGAESTDGATNTLQPGSIFVFSPE